MGSISRHGSMGLDPFIGEGRSEAGQNEIATAAFDSRTPLRTTLSSCVDRHSFSNVCDCTCHRKPEPAVEERLDQLSWRYPAATARSNHDQRQQSGGTESARLQHLKADQARR